MSISWITHKGKKILYLNYKNKTKEEMIQMLEDAAKIYRESKEKILSIDDFEGTFVSDEFMKKAKELAKEVFSLKRKKGAVLGITGVKKILLISFNSFSADKLYPFNTKEEALEFLVKD